MGLIITLFCFFFILNLTPAYPPPVYYENDRMGWHEKAKLMFLSNDLVKDSLLKMRQIMDIRQDHDDQVAYAIGMIMGRIREKYRFMIETYKDIMVSWLNYSVPTPPGLKYYRPFHFIIALEMMHYLELEIDKLVDVILEEAREDVGSNRNVAGESERLRKRKTNTTNITWPNGTIHSGKQIRSGVGVGRLLEETEKSLMRQRFLMKKLGRSPNMTTLKKRFLRHWPVEESWSLDKYNQDYK